MSPHLMSLGVQELIGHQSGAMTRGTQPRQFAGQRMLVVAAVFAGAVLVLRMIIFLLANLSMIALSLVSCLMPFVILAVVYRLILGRRAGAAWSATTRLSRGIASSLVGPGRATSAANSVAGRIRAAIRAGRVVRHIPVRHFQLHPIAGGGLVSCLLRGEPDGAEPGKGDILRVSGRREPSGDFVAQRIEVLSSTAGPTLRVIKGRLVGPVATTLWWSRACYVGSALVAGWAVFTLLDTVI